MFKILFKYLNFQDEKERSKYKKSIILDVIYGLVAAAKIPAIMLVLMGLLEGDITKNIYLSVGVMLISILIGIVVRAKGTMLETECCYTTTASKRVAIAKHLRYLPMGYFNANSLGTITSIATNTLELLGGIAPRISMMTLQGLIETSLIVLVVLCIDVRIGIISIIGVALFLLLNNKMHSGGLKASMRKVKADEGVVSEIMEYLQGISEVKSYSLFGTQAKAFNEANEECRKANTALELTFVPYMFLQSVIVKMLGVCIITASILFYINGTMPLINAIGLSISAFLIYSSLELAGGFSALIHIVDECMNKVDAILETPVMDIDGEDKVAKSSDIEVNHVEFSYGEKPIIQDISLHIPSKTTTAIVGPSGGGKTTLCNLMARFWDVDEGEVLLDGTNIRNYSMDALMRNYSFVFQSVYLFADTIENNIKFGMPEASHEMVEEAAKKACCHDFIMNLPDGYNTVIGEGGASLSGGEKQRLSIARAIMKDAPIIILDEATANVDPESEAELTKAIEALTREKTIIMIAHRLKTVRHADQIVVIDQGKIVERGTHEELMKNEGIYKRFINSRELAISWKL